MLLLLLLFFFLPLLPLLFLTNPLSLISYSSATVHIVAAMSCMRALLGSTSIFPDFTSLHLTASSYGSPSLFFHIFVHFFLFLIFFSFHFSLPSYFPLLPSLSNRFLSLTYSSLPTFFFFFLFFSCPIVAFSPQHFSCRL